MRSRAEILVYGWYHQSNLGDDLFVEAFEKLWPEYEFTFTNSITLSQIKKSQVIVFGGGSFLDCPIQCESGVMGEITKKPILYVGIGLETSIHEDHKYLIQKSRLVASRNNPRNIIFDNHIAMPDLVYSLHGIDSGFKGIREKSILVLPNVSVLPTRADQQWKHASWSYFKSEFSQFLDEMIDSGYNVRMFPMCRDNKLDDTWAASEIISNMIYRERSILTQESINGFDGIINFFSRFSFIITQRLHGAILSKMAGVPHIVISHHDKLNSPESLSYYGLTKRGLHESFQRFESRPEMCESTNFDDVRLAVRKAVSGA